MNTLLRFSCLSFLCVVFLYGFVVVQAQDEAPATPDDEAEEKEERFSEEEKAVAEYVLSSMDGEKQMLINGLRYLMRPKYEEALMEGLAYVPCPLPSLEDTVEEEMTLPEVMRLWAFIQAGWELDPNLKRELKRFVETKHRRYNDCLAAYAVPMIVCTMALRRDEIAEDENFGEALMEKAEDMMDVGMRVRALTDQHSPCIDGMYIEPMWYANQLWRILMARCATELKIKYNNHVVESDMKNLSHAAQTELGWISTQGKGMTPDNDLNSNLLALTAITLTMRSDNREINKATKRSLNKRLKYLEEILTRVEDDWPDELRTGGRLCLVRTLDKKFGPEKIKPIDWRFEIRTEAVNNMFASGAVHTEHTLVNEMGLYGRTNRGYAKAACETALACLSACGGLYPEPDKENPDGYPLADIEKDTLDLVIQSFSLLHASVLPEMPEPDPDDPESFANLEERVEYAISKAAEYLISIQNPNGSFGHGASNGGGKSYVHPAYTAACIHALLHAGYDHKDAPVKRGVEYLRSNVSPSHQGFLAYDAGIILMMYGRHYEWLAEKKGVFKTENAMAALRARQDTWASIPAGDKRLITDLVNHLDKCHAGEERGGWGYRPKQGSTGGSDNSVSQFAGCGYKAASSLGAPVNMKIFEWEAKRLIAQYGENMTLPPVKFNRYAKNKKPNVAKRYKSGTYTEKSWSGSIRPGGWGYGCSKSGGAGGGIQFGGTGMAILAAARDELWARGNLTNQLHEAIDMRIFGAQLTIANEGNWVELYPEIEPTDDSDGKKKPAGAASRPGGMRANMYDWYAVERGCVMAGYEYIGTRNVNWYRCMAGWLVDSQSEHGTWGSSLHTAWGILILRRAAPRTVTTPPIVEPQPKDEDVPGSPTTPSPVTDREKFPITPGPVKPEIEETDQEEEEDDVVVPRSPITPGPGDDEEDQPDDESGD